MKVLCPNKVPRIKRQVASVSKKAREPSDSSNNNFLPGPEHPPKVIDKQQLASFIRMVTYMGNFMPHLSHHTEPLQAMFKQEAVFPWNEMANASFQKIED